MTAEITVVTCMACTNAASANWSSRSPAPPSREATVCVAVIEPVAAFRAAAGSAVRCGFSWPR